MNTRRLAAGLLGCWIALSGVAAGEGYRVVALGDLELEGDKEQLRAVLDTGFPWMSQTSLTGEGKWMVGVRCATEAYLGAAAPVDNEWWSFKQDRLRLALRLNDDSPVSGVVDLMTPGGGLKGYAFKLDPAKSEPATEAEFLEIRRTHFERLAHDHLPGTAWFRHLAGDNKLGRGWQGQRRNPEPADTFAILSGGRAVAENLALDRDLILLDDKREGEAVNIGAIKGVTVKAIEWKSKLPAAAGGIALDPLAAAIPVDQHALFAPSLAAGFGLMRVAREEGAPMGQGFSVRNPFRTLIGRYRRQMGLDMPEPVARLLPVKSVAVTGGDPFFPTGTDVAVLFESATPGVLHAAMLTTIASKAGTAGAVAVKVEVAGAECQGFATPDRGFSAFVMRAGEVVAVANSIEQIKRLAAVATGAAPSLGGTDEFRFFRHRYPRDGRESAFLFLSDQTIRRWAGPEIRIGASRRARALAALMELTARLTEGKPLGEDFSRLLGKTEARDGRVWSEKFGTLGFLTPASELGLATATKREAAAYEQWRRGYEEGWAQVFDPIAIRLDLAGERRGFDLTVLPLTVDSDYGRMMELAGGARLSPFARAVPAEASLFLALAVDKNSGMFRNFDTELTGMLPSLKINPLGWLGGSVSLWLEDDMLLAAMANGGQMEELLPMLPLCLRAECASPLKLALFLTAIRSEVNASAPDLTTWETRRHGGQAYVVVKSGDSGLGDLTICYAAMKTALLVALNEDALKRGIDRERAGLPPAMKDQLPAGRHLVAEASPEVVQSLARLLDGRKSLSRRFQVESWKAIPVLNEWHRRQADADPVKLERDRFASEIACPGGKGYRWNAQALTMESVAYGHPAAPRDDADEPALLTRFTNLAADFEFEDGGLRVRASMGAPGGNRLPAAVAAKGEVLGKVGNFVVTDPARRFVYQSTTPDGREEDRVQRARDVKRDGGTTEFSLEVTKGADTSITRHRIDAGGLWMLGIDRKVSGFEFKEGVLQLPAEWVAGAVHRFRNKGTWTDDKGVRTDCEVLGMMRVVGREKVEVPAGMFEDCVRLETLSIYQGEALHGSASPVTHWYHPKVGLVKSEAKNARGVYSHVLLEETVAQE